MNRKDEINSLLYSTITDVNRWKDVIKEICILSGCKKGFISLRKKSNADMIFPNFMMKEFESPLLYGFTEKEISSYLLEYQGIDPWTKIEYLYHPFEPYSISDYFEKKLLLNHKFWNWLAPQNIDDSIVFEIKMYTDYWVSLNLLFSSNESETKNKSISLLKSIQDNLCNAWDLGSEYRLSKEYPTGASYFIDQKKTPSFLISPNGHVIHRNNAAIESMEEIEKSIFHISKNNTLIFSNKILKSTFDSTFYELKNLDYTPEKPLSKCFSFDGWECKCSFLGRPQDVIGTEIGSRVITLTPHLIEHLEEATAIWDAPNLTKREKELVKILASGGKVVDFQKKFNLAKSTAHSHWGKVKEKLNVRDRSEIVMKNDFFVKNNN